MKELSWDEVMKITDILANKINGSNFHPDWLVGLARGGWIPTRLLSDKITVKKLASIGITYTDSERKVLEAYSLPSMIQKGQKILLIEDRLESGKSLKKAKEIFETKGIIVKTACYFIMTKSVITPDFFLDLNDEDIIFPWE